MKIKAVKAREILDSRGNPTLETEVYLEDGSIGIASVPSGASTGKYEAIELRDNDPDRFNGMGVLKAVKNVTNIIGPKIIGLDASYQGKIDKFLIDLDGTLNKGKLGANAILSVSQGVLEASAASYKLPIYAYIMAKYQMADKSSSKLPTPSFNLINGGVHGAGNLDFQEFHLIPSSGYAYHQALECGKEIYQALKRALIYRGAIHSVGDEGGFSPNLFTNMDALEILVEAIRTTKYQIAQDVFLGLDATANYFYKNNKYSIKDRMQSFTPQELINYYDKLNKQYYLFSLEDGLYEDDWQGWAELTRKLGENTLIVGDDLLCSNKKRVQKALSEKACTAILVKPNQTGTISESIQVIKMAQEAGWKVIISHRSGETNDDFIADFAVGIGADYTKFGAPARGERIAKYNRLLKIEEELARK
jgi:enolase